MRFIFTFFLLPLMFWSCKGNDNSNQDAGEQGSIFIIIDSDTLLTTRIQTTRCYWNYNNFEVVSGGMQDTLILPVREFDLIRILNPIVDLDSVIIRAGDTLYLDIFRDGYARRHFRDGLLVEEIEINNHLNSFNVRNPELDSLQKIFFYVDFNWPFDFSFEDTRYTEYPIIPILENIKSKPDVLETYIELIFNDYLKRYQDKPSEVPFALHELYTEIYLSQIMGHIVFLYRQKPYDFLKNALFSEVFLNYREPETVPISFINRQILILEQGHPKTAELHKLLRQVYKNASAYWPDEVLVEYARYYILSKLADSMFDKELLNTKFKSYAELYPESKWVEILSDMQHAHNIQRDFVIETKDSMFHRYGESTTFPDLLNEHEGRYIFVDFWASWCAPCIKALPDIVALQKELDNPDIIFVFISIDENKNAWKNAEDRLIPDGYAYSFIAPRFSESALQKELNIMNIPRYVLFDKEGELLLNQSGLSVEEISSKLTKVFY